MGQRPSHPALHAVLVALLCVSACRRTMGPTGEPPETNPTSDYAELLQRVVTDDGYVDYDRLEEEREALDAYVAWLAGPKIWERNDPQNRHAPYLNAYNALVLYQVLERGRPDSVLDVKGWLPKPGSGFFVETQFKLGPDYLSLSEIEHERIRLADMDFRSHAALNCASMSCPPLRNSLYTQRDGSLAGQLREQMGIWVDDDLRGVRIEDGVAVFNPIFQWYARDFEFWSAGLDLCTLTSRFASGSKRTQLKQLADQGCPHRFFEYDWRLNSVENARAR